MNNREREILFNQQGLSPDSIIHSIESTPSPTIESPIVGDPTNISPPILEQDNYVDQQNEVHGDADNEGPLRPESGLANGTYFKIFKLNFI